MATQWYDVASIAYFTDGAWVPVESVAVYQDGAWIDVETVAYGGSGGATVGPARPPTPTRMWIGQYRTGPAPDEAYFADYGGWPWAAMTLVTSAVNGTIETYDRQRAQRGVTLLVDFDIRNQPAGFLAEIANWTPAGQAYVDQFLAAYQRVKQEGIDNAAVTDVILGFIRKWDLLRVQGILTNAADISVANYCAAASRFFARVEEIAPDCLTAMWTGDLGQQAVISQMMTGLTVPPDVFMFDSYVDNDETFQTALADWKPMLQFLHGHSVWPSWHGGATPVIVGGFGADSFHGDSNLATYYSGVFDAMSALGVLGAVHVDVNGTDVDGQVVAYAVDTGSTPLAEAAFVAEVNAAATAPNAAPSMPWNFHQTAIGSTTVDLAWSPAAKAPGAAAITSYRVLKDGSVAFTTAPDATSATISNLSPSTSYTFTIQASNGILGALSDPVIATTTGLVAPNAPTNLRTNGTVIPTSVPLAWDASTLPPGAQPVSEYRVSRNGAQVGVVTGLTFTDTGLSANTTYMYTVRAFNGALSASSATFGVTTPSAGGNNTYDTARYDQGVYG